jgi:hypothetical protein
METGVTDADDFQPVIRTDDFEPVKPARIPRSITTPRPLGITLLSVFYYLSSAWLLVEAILSWRRPDGTSGIQELVVLNLFGALLFFVVGFALMTLRDWGRDLAIAISVVVLLLGLDSRFSHIIFFWYLLKPHVKAAFAEAEDASYGYPSPDRLGIQT